MNISKPDDIKCLTPGQGLTKEEAMQRLLEGHWRYMHQTPKLRVISEVDRELALSGQYPFAAIVGCADSRVAPELIFDQGQGDLFVVRIAGNVVGSDVIASVEYALKVLGVRLIVILGHEKCGAVAAAASQIEAGGAIGLLLKQIKPAIEKAKDQPGVFIDNAINANIVNSAETLLNQSETVKTMVDSGDVRVVGSLYSLGTGDVSVVTIIG